MALEFSPGWATRWANNIDTSFNSIVAQLYSTSRTFPSAGTTGFTTIGSNSSSNRLVNFGGLASFLEDSGDLIFDPGSSPNPTAATGTGTASWMLLHSNNFGGEIAFPVSLAGGTGAIHIANDGAGGGSGLNIQTGDLITIVAFRLKWG